MGEFDLIKRYFTPEHYSSDVLLGVGDDAAVLDVPAGFRLVAAVDTIVEGIHFPAGTSSANIAYRSLAVNLSDMAAMGAQPKWFTLSLSLPHASEYWLSEFSSSLSELASRFGVQLVGGDTVKGPLCISIQILGWVEQGQWLTRAGAKPGDLIFVSGVPGEAAGGLQLLLKPDLQAAPEHRHLLLERFYRPTPRVELGRRLKAVATAAMDISDGLLTDLRKLCVASSCGADLQLERLPISLSLRAVFGEITAEHLALQGGDDYELLFTIPPERLTDLQSITAELGVQCTQIGRITLNAKVQCYREQLPVEIPDTGFDHFAVGNEIK